MSLRLLAIVTLIYLGVAVDNYLLGRRGMALTFTAYALANLGLMWDGAAR